MGQCSHSCIFAERQWILLKSITCQKLSRLLLTLCAHAPAGLPNRGAAQLSLALQSHPPLCSI